MSITIEHMESHSDKEMGGPEGVHLTITDNEGGRPVTLVIGHSGDTVFVVPSSNSGTSVGKMDLMEDGYYVTLSVEGVAA